MRQDRNKDERGERRPVTKVAGLFFAQMKAVLVFCCRLVSSPHKKLFLLPWCGGRTRTPTAVWRKVKDRTWEVHHAKNSHSR